jgi:hypothetical protein
LIAGDYAATQTDRFQDTDLTTIKTNLAHGGIVRVS